MALASGTLFEIKSTATTGNTGGAGFNPANANFPTDLTTDANTANTASPIVSSATYTFVAGDAGSGSNLNYLYVKSGTNWIPGFYPITAVSGGKATINATAGAGEILDATTGMYKASTATGIATVGTPTAGTFGVDYSRLDTANSSPTDLASVGASTTLTSASNPWSPVSVGNFIHITTTGTGAHFVVGWYEIVSESLVSSVVLDRTPNDGTAGVAGTGQTGGAGRLNGLEDAFFEMIPAASQVYIKGSGTHTISAGIVVASTNSTTASPSFIIGYTSVRGDTPTGSNRPTIACAANNFTSGQYQLWFNLIFTGTTANGVSIGSAGASITNCKSLNSSTTAARGAALASQLNNLIFNCELISQNGQGVTGSNAQFKLVGSYLHDSNKGVTVSNAGQTIIDNIFEANTTSGIESTVAGGGHLIAHNTIYGREAKIGIGIDLNVNLSSNNRIYNNILYGLATGVNALTTQENSNFGGYNDYYNNTTDTALYNKDRTDQAIDPLFSGASQLSGSTATTSGSVLTQSGGDFSTVTDNIDFLHVTSGTGVTVGVYLITSHTSTTVTVNNALGTSSGGDVIWWVPVGHNFAITGAI